MQKKAVILLSGGLDSTTCLAIAQSKDFRCHALSFSYGQKQSAELQAAGRVSEKFGVAEHRVVELNIGQFGASALTDTHIDIPDYQAAEGIPVTYVPARNTVFLSIALGYAEAISASHIFIGANAVDYSGYPDCRPEFIQAFQNLANVATKAGIEGAGIQIDAPLMFLNKAEIIQWGLALGVDYAWTVSCYRLNAQGEACGRCDSCALRRQGFKAAQVEDPTVYWR